jgi:hypothetical protein
MSGHIFIDAFREVLSRHALEHFDGGMGALRRGRIRPQRARAFATMIEGPSAAKTAGLSAEQVKAALAFIDEGVHV